MPRLTLTRGLPGSGKTYWARTQTGWRVSRDSIRAMFNQGWVHGDRELELQCTQTQFAAIRALLAGGKDVIVDDTNLVEEHVTLLVGLAREFNADVEIVDFRDVPLELCIQRDAQRDHPVGAEVIRRMASQMREA